MVTLQVDNREISVKEGTSLLKACLTHDIYIPHLCYLEDLNPPLASCRMCFVKINGKDAPVASCTVIVENNMVVQTDTSAVRRLQRSALKLLLSVHLVECKACPANRECDLQRIAKFLKVGLNPKPLERIIAKPATDESHPTLIHYPNRCVLCGKCVAICRREHDRPVFSFAKRGFETILNSFGQEDTINSSCRECKACVDCCPVGALGLKDNLA